MNDWQSTCLGRRSLPRELSAFEIEAFFNVSDAEQRMIKERRSPALKFALALQIGFLRTSNRGRLLQFACRWLYERRLIVLRERDLRTMIVKAIRQYEAALARSIVEAVDPLLRSRSRTTAAPRCRLGCGQPGEHSSRQIEEVLERIEVLSALGVDVDRHLAQLPDAIVRRYARRLGETGSGGRPFDTHETQAQAAEEAPMKPSTSLRIPLPIMRRDTIFWRSSRS
jgi:hypothetical protein